MAAGSTDSNGVYQYGSSDTNATFHGLLNIANAILSTTIGAIKTRLTTAENRLTQTVASLAALDALTTATIGQMAWVTTPGTGIEPHAWVTVAGSGVGIDWKPVGTIEAATQANLDTYIAAVAAISDTTFRVGGLAFISGTGQYVRFTSTAGAYVPLTAVERIIPTLTGTGGTTALDANTGEVTFSGAVTAIRLNSTTAILSRYRYVELILRYNGATAGSHTIQLCSGSTINSGAATYTLQGRLEAGATITAAAPAAGTSWSHGYVGTRKNRHRVLQLSNLADALITVVKDLLGHDSDGGSNLLLEQSIGEHSATTAFDGVVVNLSGLGAISNGSLQWKGYL